MNAELRLAARLRLQGNWLNPILVCLIIALILGIANSAGPIGGLIGLIVTGPLTLGQAGYFLRFRNGENPPIESLFDGFKQFAPALLVQLLIMIFTFLWSLLLIVPGIIAALGYSQAFYILYDQPGLDTMEVIKQSKEMMNGHKGRLFMLLLSFLGWSLLCLLTLGIGFIWLSPYIQLTLANFYQGLRDTPTVIN